MPVVGEKQAESIHPTFDKSIRIDFKAAKITSGAGFFLIRGVDGRFRLLERAASRIEDSRFASHTDQTFKTRNPAPSFAGSSDSRPKALHIESNSE
ncbi:MAG: hypothetical protein ABSG35_22635 [Syntrophobacteraceae bacterium]|jgi:hypothetical protein